MLGGSSPFSLHYMLSMQYLGEGLPWMKLPSRSIVEEVHTVARCGLFSMWPTAEQEV